MHFLYDRPYVADAVAPPEPVLIGISYDARVILEISDRAAP